MTAAEDTPRLLGPEDEQWVFQRFDRVIVAAARRLCRRPDEQDDLAQEVRVRVLKRLGSGRLEFRNPAQLGGLLQEIASGVHIDRIRYGLRRPEGSLGPEVDAAASKDDLKLSEDIVAVNDLISRAIDVGGLDQRAGEAARLHFVSGLKKAEVAAELGISQSRATKLLASATAALFALSLRDGTYESPLAPLTGATRGVAREGLLDYAHFLLATRPPGRGEQYHGPVHGQAVIFVVLTEIDSVDNRLALAEATGALLARDDASQERLVGHQVSRMYLAPWRGGQSTVRLFEYLSSAGRKPHPFEDDLADVPGKETP